MISLSMSQQLSRTNSFLFLFFALLGHGQGLCVALLFGFSPDVLASLSKFGGLVPSLRAVLFKAQSSLRASIVELRNSVSPRLQKDDSSASLDSLEDVARRSEVAAGNMLPVW